MLKNPNDSKLTHGSTQMVELICDYCGKTFSRRWSQRILSNKIIDKDSCKKCASKKREESCLKKYGTKTASGSKAVKEKASQTKGGNGRAIEDFHEQITEMYKNTSINEIAKKLGLARTTLSGYMRKIGLDTTGNIQDKAQRTCLRKYGTPHYLQSKKGQEHFKRSCKEKYGHENPFDNLELRKKTVQKRQETLIRKYGVKDILNDGPKKEEYKEKRRQARIAKGQIIYERKDVPQWIKEGSTGLETLRKNLKSILDKIGVPYNTHVYIDGKIADFVINDLVIEVDGLYWHSDKIIPDRNYHAKKRLHYIDNGYRPLFFREDEVHNKPDIITSIIKNKLGLSKRVWARKCSVKQRRRNIGHDFMRHNHLMGRVAGDTFTLSLNDDILSCITIKRLRGNHYEISRFAHKIGYSVVGGFSKLIRFVHCSLNMESLTTFIDLRYGDGLYLNDLGFDYQGEHLSFKWTDFRQTFHRMKFRGNEGYGKGLYKIYDCGQAKYQMTSELDGV